MIDKRGQVSTGMTWVVATIIIIVVIFIFLLASINLSGGKGDFGLKDRYRDFGGSKSTSVFLDSDISLPSKATYVWNDKIVLQGTDELVVGCDVDSVHFYVNYIWQDWT